MQLHQYHRHFGSENKSYDVNGPHRPIHTVRFFSDCDYYSSYRKKWAVQDSLEVFTFCDCDNITISYVDHYKEKQIAVAIRKNCIQ